MQTVGGATALMYACQQCRENEVLDLIKKQPYSVKERDRTSKTPLHYCAENPNTSCAEAVLRAAPELVNAQDENGYCTLHLAVIAGNKALIKLLITKGADVNLYDNEGHSAVHWAIVSSEKEALEMIIRAGAKPSTPDVHGGYPLHYAVQMCGSSCDHVKGFEDAVRVVETLLNFGVDVNVKDKDSRQPILWAASAGSADAVIHLVSAGACVEAADKDGLTALHCAASRGHTITLETLISLCGANVDVIDGNGCSALFYAVTLGHADATELLLRLGAEPNRQDRKGRTPAHCGAAKGQLETLRILQKHGGNLWLRNVKGDIPLHEAVASGRKDLVLWLLSQNPEAINIANNDGRCPLHIASMYNNTEMVKVLLDAKSLVNPVMRTSKGVLMTPLNVALCKGHRSCGKYLQLHGGVPFSKVARLEPASVFAVRVSPSDEMMVKAGETNKEVLEVSHIKTSRSRSSVDIRGSQESDTGEKKKVYRRRRKKRSASTVGSHSENSDSDESIRDARAKTPGGRKAKKSTGRDEHEERTKSRKVQGSTERFRQERNIKNFQGGNSKTVSTAEDGEIIEERVTARKATKTKTLQPSKSFNETKNVSDLSPEDFPPLMQTINQLDAVMMEPDIDENKLEGDGTHAKLQDVAAADSGCVRVIREPETEGRDTGVEVGAAPAVQNEENLKADAEVKEEDIKKEVVSSVEKSGKDVDVRKDEDDTETKMVESKSSGEDSSARKSVKSPKASANSGSGKKDERLSKSEKTSSAGSDGSERQKKTGRSKSPKVTIAEQTIEKSAEASDATRKDEIEKVLDPEEKIEEVKESGRVQAEPETGDPTGGVVVSGNNPTEVEDVAGAESERRENDLFSSEKRNEKEVSANDEKEGEIEPPQTRVSEEETKNGEGKESPDVIVTERREEGPNSSEERGEVSSEVKPSARALELPSDCDQTGNPEEHSSEVLPPETLPVENSSGKNTPKDEELERIEAEETIRENPKSVSEEEFPDLNVSNKGREEVELEEKSREEEEGTPGDGVSKEEDKKGEEVKSEGNEGNEGEEGQLDEGGSSRKSEAEHPPPKAPRVSRLCRRQRDFKGDINDVSVTQLVQNTLRKYHMERGIFYQLLELKRYQIRSGRANEQVLVKRLADEYERSRVFLGAKPYSGLYKFREFEKFLYDQLKALNARRSFLIPEIKSYDDIDALSGFLKKSRYRIINDTPQPETVCTCITQRCHHSAGAYTSVPCSAYITDLRRHRRHKPKREGLFPRIQQTPSFRSEPDKYPGRPATLELIQGSEKHVITLPQNSPGKGKRYYVTFTIKGGPTFEEENLAEDPKNFLKHRHAKSV